MLEWIIAALGASVVALAVWFAVRIVNRRAGRPLLPRRFWTALTAAALITAVAATYTGVRIYLRHCRQMRVIAVIERLGGGVSYRSDTPLWLQRLQPDEALRGIDGFGPNWVRMCLPARMIVDRVWVVDTVSLDNGPGRQLSTNVSGEARDESRRAEHVDPTDDDLLALADLPALENVFLRDTRITDAGLRHLKPLREIKTLALGKTQITDEGMEVVAGFEKLERLRLYGTRVTDASLAKITALKHLKEVDVRSTDVSKAGVEFLRDNAELRVRDSHVGIFEEVFHY